MHRWLATRALGTVLLGAALVGCAALSPMPFSFEPTSPETDYCLSVYRALNQETEATGAIDARHSRVPGLPFLRTSRFWSSFESSSLGSDAYKTWLLHQNALAVEGLTVEWLRLNSHQQRNLRPLVADTEEAVTQVLTECGESLIDELAALTSLPPFEVKDHYQTWKRWLGLYPLAALPFYRGVVEEHQELSQRQSRFAEGLPTMTTEQWQFFGTPPNDLSPTEALTLLSEQPIDPLGIPLMNAATRQRLLSAFRPTIAVQAIHGELAENDQPIRLSVHDNGQLRNDTAQPTLYTDITFGRYRDQITVQLTYSVWFSERRPEGPIDLLAGRYNGVAWRVHLLPTGAVIGFDKMHLCGCWYQFFPAMGFRAKPDLPITQEPFHLGESVDPRARQTLWLATNTHHLLGVSPRSDIHSGKEIEARAFNDLRAIAPTGVDRHFSPFNEVGLLPESERLERWVFWPMGIRNPGALRLFGTHAIAFIGRRHFDDPGLLEELGL